VLDARAGRAGVPLKVLSLRFPMALARLAPGPTCSSRFGAAAVPAGPVSCQSRVVVPCGSLFRNARKPQDKANCWQKAILTPQLGRHSCRRQVMKLHPPTSVSRRRRHFEMHASGESGRESGAKGESADMSSKLEENRPAQLDASPDVHASTSGRPSGEISDSKGLHLC
jgi:hypothetical protein